MRFWRTRTGKLVLAPLALIVLLIGAATALVHRVTTPPRRAADVVDFEAVRLEVEGVSFRAADDTRLAGWLLPGRRGRSPVILAHDFAADKASLLELAITLHERGFPVLLFDFRGHGESGGGRSTLGVDEKRDVLAAVDFLADREDLDAKTLGLYGVGMGAYATVLAAPERASMRILVLDGLYPDVGYPLTRRFYGGWRAGSRWFAFVPERIFQALNGVRISDHGAGDVLAGLEGRDLLLLAPAGDSSLATEMQRIYQGIPEQPDVEGNLVILPATQSQGLYGTDLARHHGRVLEFLTTRLEPRADIRTARR